MSNLEKVNSFTELKQPTAADKKTGRVVTQRHKGDTIADDPILLIPFAVIPGSKNFLLFVDGDGPLTEDEDFEFTSVQPNGTSKEITLFQTPSSVLPFQALLLGVELAPVPNASQLQSQLIDVNTEIEQVGQMSRAAFKPFIVKPSLISVPNTTIQNRVQILDMSNDLAPRFGVERIMTQKINIIPNEFGPNGERVYGVEEDKFDRLRFVGNWIQSTPSQSRGIFLWGNSTGSATPNDFLEITFYGTGLTILTTSEGSRDYRATVDGGAESGNLFTTGYSAVINGQVYGQNQVIRIVTGLALGLHTVKIRNAGASQDFKVFGLEILTEQATANVRPGIGYDTTKKLSLLAASNQALKTGFESGTIGTRGGRVLMYLKSDGTIGRAITPTNLSAAYLGAADHTNEEVIRRYSFREFGVGRGDDFSTLALSPSNRAFTLDDGTVSLFGKDIADIGPTFDNTLSTTTSTAYITITFVGTGIDLFRRDSGNNTTDSHDFYIDGALVASIASGAATVKTPTQYKIASGLPYGTHVLKIQRTAGILDGVGAVAFIVYGPKKPTIPADAVEIGSYFVMADYATNNAFINSTAIAQGVLRKNGLREANYFGAGWSYGSVDPNTDVVGFSGSTSTNGDYFERTFFGTGFEYRAWYQNNQGNMAISIVAGPHAGTSNFTGFTTSFTAVNGFTFTPATGIVTQPSVNDHAYGVSISGLTLGLHTVRFTRTAGGASGMFAAVFDAITPIHVPSDIMPYSTGDGRPVGNMALADSRVFSPIEELQTERTIGQVDGILTNPSINSSVFFPIPDMILPFKSNGKKAEIAFDANIDSGTANVSLAIFVDGINITGHTSNYSSQNGIRKNFGLRKIVELEKGVHVIAAYWHSGGGGTLTASGADRLLCVKEIE